jgi:hypothetical protein
MWARASSPERRRQSDQNQSTAKVAYISPITASGELRARQNSLALVSTGCRTGADARAYIKRAQS